MPLQVSDDLPDKFPEPDYLTLDNFKRGVITLVNAGNLPKNALAKAQNTYLAENGLPTERPGIDWFGTTLPTGRSGLQATYVNLCTNPSFEVDDSGWSVGTESPYGAGFTPGSAVIQGTAYRGTSCLALFDSSDKDSYAGGVTYTLALTAAHTYQASVWVRLDVDNVAVSASLGDAASTSVTANSNGWTKLVSASFTPAADGNADLFISPAAYTAGSLYIDAVLIQDTTDNSLTDYFDGDTTDTELVTYDWDGTAGASTSTQQVYTSTSNEIDGFDYFDADGEIHLVVVSGGTVYRSLDDGVTWDECTGGTLTPGSDVSMNQNNNYLSLVNGVDEIVRYDGTTTLVNYAALTTPDPLTIAKTGLATGTSYSYWYKSSAVDEVGFTAASTATKVQVGIPRSGWDATTNFLTLTMPALQDDQTRYDIYFSEDGLNFYYLASSVGTVFKDDGTAVPVPSTVAPTGNTTKGPKVKILRNVGIRQYGVGDPDRRERIWFTGAGVYSGAFSNAYDGGYLDYQPGGKFYPVDVEEYQDGHGEPMATIWCDSADGRGCILQMSLSILTVGDISITVPSAYRLPGSRGTPAPGSVVNVLNDYMFYNSQAIYDLGSRAKRLGLISTDEYSSDIRPTIRQVNKAAEGGIVSVFNEGMVLISVPMGDSTVNNQTILYDTELDCWIPEAFTCGFKRFLRYTDHNKEQRLLALKPGDNRLSEISDQIAGDYGQDFEVHILTGLFPTVKNRYEFQFTEEVEAEFSNPQNILYLETLGVDRPKGFHSIKTVPIEINASVTNAGWDVANWDELKWDDTSVVPKALSEVLVKRYTTIQRELNAIQFHIYSQSRATRFTLRSIQSWGTPTQGGHPSSWRLSRL